MNLNVCKKCLNASNIKIIESRYYDTKNGFKIQFVFFDNEGYSFDFNVWTNSPEAISVTKYVLPKINVRSCSFAEKNNYHCPYEIEHQIYDWNKENES